MRSFFDNFGLDSDRRHALEQFVKCNFFIGLIFVMEQIAIKRMEGLGFLVLVLKVEYAAIQFAHFLACVLRLAFVQGFRMFVVMRRAVLLQTLFCLQNQGLYLVRNGDASLLLQKRVFFLKIEGLFHSVLFLSNTYHFLGILPLNGTLPLHFLSIRLKLPLSLPHSLFPFLLQLQQLHRRLPRLTIEPCLLDLAFDLLLYALLEEGGLKCACYVEQLTVSEVLRFLVVGFLSFLVFLEQLDVFIDGLLLLHKYCFYAKNEQNGQVFHEPTLAVFLSSSYQFLLPVSVYIKSIKMASDYGDWLHAQKIYSSNHSQMDQRQQLYERGVVSILKNESLISLLSTRPPFARNQKECRAIADLLKAEPYFQNISKNFKTLLEISSWIEYKRSQPGEYIYKVHDVSDCFYVLINGEVHLTYPEKEVLEVEEESMKENEANSMRNLKESTFYPTAVPNLVKNLSISPNKPHMEETKTPKRLTRHQSLFGNDVIQISIPTPKKQLFTQRIVQMITNGQSFGDMGDSNRRGTNAIAKQSCNLLVIKKQHYSTLSNAHIKSQNKVKYDILSSIPLFKLLYRYALEEIIYLLEEVKVGYNTIIYNQNDLVRYTYVIYKGEFKLYKKVRSRKDSARTVTQENEEPRCVTKNLSFKTIQIGQILGYTESYRKISNHLETCVCKSQDGIVLRIDKNKFLKKITSTQNNLEEIIPFIEDKVQKKNQEINDFLKKHQNDIFVRYLHTPSANARRVNTESTVYKMKSQRKDQLRKLSTASDNFFNEFNKTVKQEVRSTRISIKKCVALKMDQKGEIPSRIKDIIGIVNQQSNYYKIRKPKENITLFEFNISKVPIHVKKKYEILFKKQNK